MSKTSLAKIATLGDTSWARLTTELTSYIGEGTRHKKKHILRGGTLHILS